MTKAQTIRFHQISDRMSRIHTLMLQKPLRSLKPVGEQKTWLKLYDELNRIGTVRDRHR
jgi:hypothetical protein